MECGGYTRAADACLTANQTSAVLTEALAGRLAATSGMAGNDATSTGFAAAYDGSARVAVAALADLTHAFIGAGRLLAATGAHHAAAEEGAGGTAVLGYAGDLHESAYARISPALPPTSLGPQEPSLGVVDAWILDQVEGFAWPGADIERLRAAGDAWRRAAASTAGLADGVDVAVSMVEAQRSPEVPLAVEALTGLATLIGDVAWQLSGLATACDDYADAVEEARARTRALLVEVAQMIVEGAAISVVITGLSGGLGGGATVAAAAARVRAQAPRFHALLTALRTGVAAPAARLERVGDELTRVRSRVERFLHVPARSEMGAIRAGRGADRAAGVRRSKPSVEDPKLKNLVNQLFKGVDNPGRIGDGTTMAAIRHELATGDTVHHRRHIVKGQETVRGLENWLRKNLDASTSDRTLAHRLADELREALRS